MTLRQRITLLVAIAVAVTVTAISVLAYYSARRELIGEVDEFLVSRAAVVDLVGERGFPRGLPFPGLIRPGLEFGAEGIIGTDSVVQFIDADGNSILTFEDAPILPVSEADLDLIAEGQGRLLRDAEVDGVPYRMITAPLGDLGGLQIARSLAESHQVLADFGLSLLLIGMLGVVLSALAGWLVAGRALVPVAQLTDAAEHVAETQDLGASIDIERDDELGRLARSFNTMLEALDQSRRQQQRLVMDAGHELRTPITSLRTNLEVLVRNEDMGASERDELLSDVGTELNELTMLVSELVELATDAGVADEPTERVRLDEVVAASVDLARRRTGREIELSSEESWIEGRPAMLERAVGNLLDNAHKWSSDGQTIEVRVTSGRVTVRDHGPGIPENDRPYVFDRFYRAPEARSLPGSGLGLSIVRQIAEAHEGRAWVEAANGGGTIAGIEIPTA